ncbi:MAG: hypothetical protein V3U72_04650 [Candidatus Aenigmarchaeota archaeon]
MGVFEEIVKNKEELFMKVLQILEGKETKTKINLDGVEFNIGNSKVSVNGNVEFTIVPFVKKK